MKPVKVYLIGAGSGSPDLITVRGRRILEAADTIIYDYLLDPGFLDYAREGAECIPCSDTGKRHPNPARRKKAQEKINRIMIRKSREGKKVARLKNGDVSIFSRCSEELDALRRQRIEFELVPGVTAASTAAAFSGIPLTDRELSSSVILVTGHEDINKGKSSIDWKGVASSGTIVLYMSVCVIDKVAQLLIEAGKSGSTPVVAVSEAGSPSQRIASAALKDIPGEMKRAGIKAPAVFIIGQTVKKGKHFNWYARSKRVLFTGLSDERFFIRGKYIYVPMIKIVPADDYKMFDRNVKKINNFDWIVFTSRYGVEYFFKRMKKNNLDSRELAGVNAVVIGRSTGNHLLRYFIKADIMPQDESSSGLKKELAKINLKGKKVFLPRSDISDKGLEKFLKKSGAVVTSSIAYKNVMPDDLPDIDIKEFDEIMFTSPSTVRNFKKRYRALPAGVKVKCIGEVTRKEAERCL